MSTTKTLTERLTAHPELEKRISKLIDTIEAESGHFDRADEAEEAVIHHLKEMGNELLKDWAAYKENQKFEETLYLHPDASTQKKHTLDEHLRQNQSYRAMPDYYQTSCSTIL